MRSKFKDEHSSGMLSVCFVALSRASFGPAVYVYDWTGRGCDSKRIHVFPWKAPLCFKKGESTLSWRGLDISDFVGTESVGYYAPTHLGLFSGSRTNRLFGFLFGVLRET